MFVFRKTKFINMNLLLTIANVCVNVPLVKLDRNWLQWGSEYWTGPIFRSLSHLQLVWFSIGNCKPDLYSRFFWIIFIIKTRLTSLILGYSFSKSSSENLTSKSSFKCLRYLEIHCIKYLH